MSNPIALPTTSSTKHFCKKIATGPDRQSAFK